MRSHVIPALVLSSAALAGAGGVHAAAETVATETVATVNGARISRDQLLNELLVRHGGAVLEDMVRELVVRQAVARAGLKVAEDEVDVEIDRERRGLAAKGKNLEEMVGSKYQMSMTGYRSIVRRWLLIRKLMLGGENPSNAQVMVWFYENRARRYDTPAEYTVSHIYVSLENPGTGKERTQAEVQGRVEAVRNGVLRGQDFAALAKRYSDDSNTRDRGGALGTVNGRAARTHLEPNFVEAMVRLKPGQSGMVSTPRGYHFIKMLARKDGRQARYEEYRKIARADYLEDRALLGRELFLRKLMGRARVEMTFSPPERGESAAGRDIVRDTDEDADEDADDTKEKP